MKKGRGVLGIPGRCNGMSKTKKALKNIQEKQDLSQRELHKARLSRAFHTLPTCLTYTYGEQINCSR